MIEPCHNRSKMLPVILTVTMTTHLNFQRLISISIKHPLFNPFITLEYKSILLATFELQQTKWSSACREITIILQTIVKVISWETHHLGFKFSNSYSILKEKRSSFKMRLPLNYQCCRKQTFRPMQWTGIFR